VYTALQNSTVVYKTSTYVFQPCFKDSVVPAIISDLWRSIFTALVFFESLTWPLF